MISVLTWPLGEDFLRNLRWWSYYILIQVVCHVLLSSMGAFFHFLLNHEIAIVEGWLHSNGWELAVLSKVVAVWMIYWLLRVRLYRPRKVREFFKTEWSWPSKSSGIITIFLLLAFCLLAAPVIQPQNVSYFGYHLIAYFCCVTWLLIDYFCVALLHDLFPVSLAHRRGLLVTYLVGFAIAFQLVVPDYFGSALVMHLHFFTILILAGPRFQRWSDVAVYLLFFAAPAAAIFGLDPHWGRDFSPLRFTQPLAMPFLLIIWMISWLYYLYRDRLRGRRLIFR